MYDNHFERVEEKYLLSKELFQKLMAKINGHITEDDYFKSYIHNIYFDTINNDLIINSLDKPVFKDKFRVRSYGVPDMDDYIFLEQKTKYKGVVGKRRIKVKLKDYYDYVFNHNNISNDQIFKEIDYYFNYYKLKPAIYIAYDRISYKGIDNDHLRVTFDYNLRSRRNNLVFGETKDMVKYFENDEIIMEIKTVGSIPLWLAHTLSELKIMPTSFSKYGKIYEKEMKGMI